jgi:tetratricopeptide (TPR) repeat protein
MTWRGASSAGSWTRSLGIALAGLACIALPAAAQLARIQASPNAPKLIVVPFGRVTPADSDIATEIADAFRDRIRLAHGEDFNVILKKGMCDNLEASGFACTNELEPSQVGQLANVLNARYIADGRLFPRGDSLLVLVRLVQAIRSNPMSTVASVVISRARLSPAIGNTLADKIADNFRSFEYITTCRTQREQKNFQRALDAATRALRYDPQSGGAYLCMALVRQDQGDPADSVLADLLRAHEADSLNTVVARQLAGMFEEKHDTVQLLHMLHHILQVDFNDNQLRIATAKVYVARNQPDSAVMLLDTALIRNPNQYDLVMARAISLGAWQKWADAGATMAQAADLDSSKVDSTFIIRIIEFYDRAGDSTRAFDWVHRATQKLPSAPSYWYRYGIGLLAKGDTAGAAAAVRQFMTLAPTDGRGHLVTASLLLAMSEHDSTLADSALAHAKMAADVDSAYRPAAANIFLRVGVKALQAQNYVRADTLLTQAKAWSGPQTQPTATFYLGVAEFQRGYQAVQAAQAAQGPARTDPTQRDAGCAAVKSAGDFLNLAEPNITSAVAVNRELANQLLNYIPTLRTALPQLARGLRCPS